MQRWLLLNCVFCMVGVVLLLTGCAATGEQQAFREWVVTLEKHHPDEQRLPVVSTTPKQVEDQASTGGQWPVDAGLDAVISQALQHNPGVKAALREWQAMLWQLPQSRAWPDPRLMFKYRDMSEEFGYSVGQMIPGMGKLKAAVKVDEAKARAARQQYLLQRRDVLRDVRKLWAELSYVQQAQQTLSEQVGLLKVESDTLLIGVRTGTVTQAQHLRALAEIDRMKNELADLRDMQPMLSARLNALLDRSADAPLPTVVELPDIELPAVKVGDEIDLGDKHPALAMAAEEMAAAGALVRQAGKARIPDFEIEAGYEHDDMKEGAMLPVGVTLPINPEPYEAKKKQALAGFAAAKHQYQQRERTLQSEWAMSRYQVRQAQRQVVLLRDTLLPRAKQTIEAQSALYRSGQSDLVETLAARREVTALELALQRARANLFAQWADWQWFMNEDENEVIVAPSVNDETEYQHAD